MVKIAALAAAGAILAVVVKRHSPEHAPALSLAAAAAVIIAALTALSPVTAYINALAEDAGLDAGVLTQLLKCVGIAALAKITAEFCRDAKESGIAAAAEFAGGALIAAAALPLAAEVIALVRSMT